MVGCCVSCHIRPTGFRQPSAKGIAVACAIHLQVGTDGTKGVIERLREAVIQPEYVVPPNHMDEGKSTITSKPKYHAEKQVN